MKFPTLLPLVAALAVAAEESVPACGYDDAECHSAFTAVASGIGLMGPTIKLSTEYFHTTSNQVLNNLLECATRYTEVKSSLTAYSIYPLLPAYGRATTATLDLCGETDAESSSTESSSVPSSTEDSSSAQVASSEPSSTENSSSAAVTSSEPSSTEDSSEALITSAPESATESLPSCGYNSAECRSALSDVAYGMGIRGQSVKILTEYFETKSNQVLNNLLECATRYTDVKRTIAGFSIYVMLPPHGFATTATLNLCGGDATDVEASTTYTTLSSSASIISGTSSLPSLTTSTASAPITSSSATASQDTVIPSCGYDSAECQSALTGIVSSIGLLDRPIHLSSAYFENTSNQVLNNFLECATRYREVSASASRSSLLPVLQMFRFATTPTMALCAETTAATEPVSTEESAVASATLTSEPLSTTAESSVAEPSTATSGPSEISVSIPTLPIDSTPLGPPRPSQSSTVSGSSIASAVSTTSAAPVSQPTSASALVDSVVSSVLSSLLSGTTSAALSTAINNIATLFLSALGPVLTNLLSFLFSSTLLLKRDTESDAIAVVTQFYDALSAWLAGPQYTEFLALFTSLQEYSDPSSVQSALVEALEPTYTAAKTVIDKLAATYPDFATVAQKLYSTVDKLVAGVVAAIDAPESSISSGYEGSTGSGSVSVSATESFETSSGNSATASAASETTAPGPYPTNNATATGPTTQINTVTKYTTIVSTEGTVVVTTTEPCETTAETVVIEGGVTRTVTAPCSKCLVSTKSNGEVVTISPTPEPVVTVTESCSVCKTHTSVSSGVTTYTTKSGDTVVTVTEPCESTYTVVESPYTSSGSVGTKTTTLVSTATTGESVKSSGIVSTLESGAGSSAVPPAASSVSTASSVSKPSGVEQVETSSSKTLAQVNAGSALVVGLPNVFLFLGYLLV